MWKPEYEVAVDELDVLPQMSSPSGPPRVPRIGVGSFDDFFRDGWRETNRVEWASASEVKSMMVVVLLMSAFFVSYLNIIDIMVMLAGRAITKLLALSGGM